AEQEVVRAGLDRAVERLRNDLGDRIFGEDGDTLEGVLGDMLVVRGLTIAVAESCTGGSVASRITRVPGSSGYFLGGVVAYDNRVKIRQLGVSEADLEEHGAVGEPVVRQMAEGVRIALGADIGVATTGIAGPDGGTPEKPVGTVWLGYADAQSTYAVRLQLSRDRVINIRLSTTAALNLVRRQLLRTDRLGASKQNRS
ncbi:MAG: nicotinamide-nucleotide amidohydrolase family protein, partial [Bacteroidetes bacterium]|nr:nicotinamide-nucleotide amidohydrolase family protein [Bacteroidota bacterium]